MGERRDIRRLMKWGGLAVCLPVLAAFSASWVWTIFYQGEGWGLRLDEGIATVHWGYATDASATARGPSGWTARPMRHRLGFRFLWPTKTSRPDGLVVVHLPMWVLLVPLAAATVLLWWPARRQHPPGHCRRCGYDLTGNLSGRCPECGERVAPPTPLPVAEEHRSQDDSDC